MEQGQGNQADITASGGGGLGCVMWTGARHYALTVTARSDPCDPATNGGAEAANRPNGSATTTTIVPGHAPRRAGVWGCIYRSGGLAPCTGSKRQAAAWLFLNGLQSFLTLQAEAGVAAAGDH